MPPHGSYGMSIGGDAWCDWIDFRIAGEDGEDVAPGEVGEILPARAERDVALRQRGRGDREGAGGGWLHTGDMATIDDAGFIFFVDRSKSMIRRGGMNIAAAEVEGVVARTPPSSRRPRSAGRTRCSARTSISSSCSAADADASEDEIIEFCQALSRTTRCHAL